MDRQYGPMGLRKNFGYDEVLRAIGQQPLDLPAPKRAGLKTYESILFSNLINDQSSYDGGAKKGGLGREGSLREEASSRGAVEAIHVGGWQQNHNELTGRSTRERSILREELVYDATRRRLVETVWGYAHCRGRQRVYH